MKIRFNHAGETDIPNMIQMYMHCGRCIQEKPEGVSPRDYMRFEVGTTPDGVQVRCVRHDLNVNHITARIIARR